MTERAGLEKLTSPELNTVLRDLYNQLPPWVSHVAARQQVSREQLLQDAQEFVQIYEWVGDETARLLADIQGADEKGLAFFRWSIYEGLFRFRNKNTNGPLLREVEQLLWFAPITPSFKTYILQEFQEKSEIGVLKKDQKPDFNFALQDESQGINTRALKSSLGFEWLLDNDEPDSGGIFDPARAREIERQGYMTRLALTLSHQQMMRVILGELASVSPLFQALDKVYETRDWTLPDEDLLAKWRQEFVAKYREEP